MMYSTLEQANLVGYIPYLLFHYHKLSGYAVVGRYIGISVSLLSSKYRITFLHV
jgi:hypothetical protein